MEGLYVLFEDSIVTDIDTIIIGSKVQRNDVYSFYNYMPGFALYDDYFEASSKRASGEYNSYHIVIWEFKNLAGFPIDSVQFRFDESLECLKIRKGEIFEEKSNNPVSIHFGFKYNKMNINADEKSKIINPDINGKSYKGFLRELSRVSLSNEKEKHEIFIDYKPQRRILFLVVNKKEKFFVITISCNKMFDESIIRILNLE